MDNLVTKLVLKSVTANKGEGKMTAAKGSTVHPWYKGNHTWKVKEVAHLGQPVKYHDEDQGNVTYDPQIMLLEAPAGCTALWFNYRIAADKTHGKMSRGGGPPIIEEYALLELIKNGIENKVFSREFLNALAKEIKTT
jgi:hypothetical protein